MARREYWAASDGTWRRPGWPNLGGIDREALVLGVDMPGPGRCGLTDASLLQTVAAATTTFTAANNGQTISNQDYNQIKFNGVVGMTFRNCRIKGLATTPSSDGELVIATNAANANIQFIDCLFEPQNPYWLSRIARGHGIKMLRCECRHHTDGIAVNNSAGYTATTDQGIDIRQSWFHDCWLASPDPGAAGGVTDNMSHIDVVAQISGGTGMYFGGNRASGLLGAGLEDVGTQITSFSDQTPLRTGSDGYRMSDDTRSGGTITYHNKGNKYYDYVRDAAGNVVEPAILQVPYPQYAQATSLFMFSSSIGDLGDVTIEKNWFDGGAVGINLNDYNTAGQPFIVGNFRITDNRWGPPDGSAAPSFRLGPDFTIINSTAGGVCTITGNVRTDTGAAFNQVKW